MTTPRRPPPPLMPQSVRKKDPVPVPSSGLGLTSDRARERMVQRLTQAGIKNAAVLNAMRQISRHVFVDQAFASRAYEDAALPIGHEQTISRPFIVARVAEHVLAIDLPVKKVLDVGTGCGYQAAVLSKLFADVYSVERIHALHEKAKFNLRQARQAKVRLMYGDGLAGLPEAAPFDAIVVAAAGLEVPAALLEQLAIGGRLVVPVAEGQKQVLAVIDRIGPKEWHRENRDAVKFVPLLPGTRTK